MMSNDYGGAYYGNSNMDYDDESSQETQQTQQATQVATQPSESQTYAANASFWGFLQPTNDQLARLDLFKIRPTYTLGRHPSNAIVLPGFKVSNKHCEIEWNGVEGKGGTVIVRDFSSNGTFINGEKIGRDKTRVLRDGNEIAFGSPAPQPSNQLEDYRFIYRYMAAGLPTTGFYAFYDIGTELGKGSFATVMKAVNRNSGIWYAVKMIKDKSKRSNQDGGGGGAIKNTSIAREIGIMEALKHPNICGLFEVFMEEESPDINLVMELVEGGDLLEYILNRNGLSEDEARHITYQICNALSYVHGTGITHRDLKPENILLTKDDPPVVKIADFGLAKIVDSMTMLRTMCGTPSYLAPEVVKQEHHEGYTSLVDSWSVGVIVFSMLTNSSPFIEDEGQTNLRIRIIERVIDWDTLTSRPVSDEAVDFVRRLMDEDPSRRMSLTDGLSHPWLASYVPEHPVPLAGVTIQFNSQSSSQNSSQGSGATRYLNNLGLNSVSEGRPLQRRSDIMNQAAEGSRAVPQPPPEMIAHSYALDEEEEELSQRLSQSQGQAPISHQQATRGKRVRANLTPLDEDSEDEEEDSLDSSSSGGMRGSNGSGGQATRSKRPRLRSEV